MLNCGIFTNLHYSLRILLIHPDTLAANLTKHTPDRRSCLQRTASGGCGDQIKGDDSCVSFIAFFCLCLQRPLRSFVLVAAAVAVVARLSCARFRLLRTKPPP